MKPVITYYRRCLGCPKVFETTKGQLRSVVPFYHRPECKPVPSTMDRLEVAFAAFLAAELPVPPPPQEPDDEAQA